MTPNCHFAITVKCSASHSSYSLGSPKDDQHLYVLGAVHWHCLCHHNYCFSSALNMLLCSPCIYIFAALFIGYEYETESLEKQKKWPDISRSFCSSSVFLHYLFSFQKGSCNFYTFWHIIYILWTSLLSLLYIYYYHHHYY